MMILTNENSPDRKRYPLLIHIRLIKLIQHPIQLWHCPILISYNGELQPRAIRVQRIDIFDPPFVRGHIVGGKTDELDTPRGEIGVRESNGGEFRGADGSVVVRVGEEDGPRPVEPVVELSPKLVTPRKQVWRERERDEKTEWGNLNTPWCGRA